MRRLQKKLPKRNVRTSLRNQQLIWNWSKWECNQQVTGRTGERQSNLRVLSRFLGWEWGKREIQALGPRTKNHNSKHAVLKESLNLHLWKFLSHWWSIVSFLKIENLMGRCSYLQQEIYPLGLMSLLGCCFLFFNLGKICFFKKFYSVLQLVNNVVLVSGVQQSDPVIHITVTLFF